MPDICGMTTNPLLARIDAYLARTGRKASWVSHKLFKSGHRLDQVRAGAGMTMATYGQAMAIMDELEAQPFEQEAA